jgi:hypothetical protein
MAAAETTGWKYCTVGSETMALSPRKKGSAKVNTMDASKENDRRQGLQKKPPAHRNVKHSRVSVLQREKGPSRRVACALSA